MPIPVENQLSIMRKKLKDERDQSFRLQKEVNEKDEEIYYLKQLVNNFIDAWDNDGSDEPNEMDYETSVRLAKKYLEDKETGQ